MSTAKLPTSTSTSMASAVSHNGTVVASSCIARNTASATARVDRERAARDRLCQYEFHRARIDLAGERLRGERDPGCGDDEHPDEAEVLGGQIAAKRRQFGHRAGEERDEFLGELLHVLRDVDLLHRRVVGNDEDRVRGESGGVPEGGRPALVHRRAEEGPAHFAPPRVAAPSSPALSAPLAAEPDPSPPVAGVESSR